MNPVNSPPWESCAFGACMKLSRFPSILAASLALALPSLTFAAPLTVTNPSFEDITNETAYNEFTFGNFNGWQYFGPNTTSGELDADGFFIGTLDPTPGTWFTTGATDGERVAIAFLFFNQRLSGEFGLTQTLTHNLAPNTTYTLEVDIGNIASGIALDNTPYNLSGFPGYRIDLLAGNTLLTSDLNTLSPADGQWATSTLTYTTGNLVDPNQALQIRLVNLNNIDPNHPTADIEVDFDNVRLSAVPAIPEPASLTLLAPALLLLKRRTPRTRSAASHSPS